jgi:hypothetical protein
MCNGPPFPPALINRWVGLAYSQPAGGKGRGIDGGWFGFASGCMIHGVCVLYLGAGVWWWGLRVRLCVDQKRSVLRVWSVVDWYGCGEGLWCLYVLVELRVSLKEERGTGGRKVDGGFGVLVLEE